MSVDATRDLIAILPHMQEKLAEMPKDERPRYETAALVGLVLADSHRPHGRISELTPFGYSD